MCGIAGFIRSAADDGAERTLRRMTAAIRHRGPDDDGHFLDDGVALGHRRLSIIDLSGGHQPMPNEDERRWIVYNGEVFNHAKVRTELEAAGHRYRNHSDTETLLHAWEQWGPASVERFRGMFAYAIWDRDRQHLFAVRDRLGIKPFYYYWDGRTFAFASEIKALLEHPAVPRAPEDASLDEYLAFGYVSGERTLFQGVRRLLPGHWLSIDCPAGGAPRLRIEQYWDAPKTEQRPEEARYSDADWIRECRRRLEETVEMRLMSDVPIGSFLSGGADSSAITALMQKFLGKNVKTFSVGYQEGEFSELGYAAEVARHLGTEHSEVVVTREDFFGALPKLIWHEDEPITWPSSVSLHFVAKLAAERVKVVLTGEGADEMFAGYGRYRFTAQNLSLWDWYGHVPDGVRRFIRGQVDSSPLLKAELRRKLGHTVFGRDGAIESLYLDNFLCAFSAAQIAELRGSGKAGNASEAIYGGFRAYWDARADQDTLARMLYADQKTYLAELLMKQDQMSMSVSIESRVPFLDHTFVEFSTRVPGRLKIHGGEQKYIVKEAVRDLIPAPILFRKKMGFPTPLKDWLRSDPMQPVLDQMVEQGSFCREFLDPAPVARLLERARADREDATDRLWRLLNLECWGRVFFRGEAAELDTAALLQAAPAGSLAGRSLEP